jgi:hypothetical protein
VCTTICVHAHTDARVHTYTDSCVRSIRRLLMLLASLGYDVTRGERWHCMSVDESQPQRGKLYIQCPTTKTWVPTGKFSIHPPTSSMHQIGAVFPCPACQVTHVFNTADATFVKDGDPPPSS